MDPEERQAYMVEKKKEARRKERQARILNKQVCATSTTSSTQRTHTLSHTPYVATPLLTMPLWQTTVGGLWR